MKVTKRNLKFLASWKRAWYGRLLHCFIGGSKTLCGQNLVSHSYDNQWEHIGYPDCKRCNKKYREIMNKEE